MNAIVLDPEVVAWLSSLASIATVPNADATVGWKSEADRLEQGAKRREREPRQ
jgi:hypothetical protein